LESIAVKTKPHKLQAGSFLLYFYYLEEISTPVNAPPDNYILFTDSTGESLFDPMNKRDFEEKISNESMRVIE
jgi:hypothetical protein